MAGADVGGGIAAHRAGMGERSSAGALAWSPDPRHLAFAAGAIVLNFGVEPRQNPFLLDGFDRLTARARHHDVGFFGQRFGLLSGLKRGVSTRGWPGNGRHGA